MNPQVDTAATVSVDTGSTMPVQSGIGLGPTSDADTGLRLLLLEDDQALRQMLVWEFSELGYQVVAVGSCGDARSAVLEEPVDVALLDVGLPDGDGAELAAKMIEAKPSLRVVLCSGRPSSLNRDDLPSEILALLTKPVSVRRLDTLFRGEA